MFILGWRNEYLFIYLRFSEINVIGVKSNW